MRWDFNKAISLMSEVVMVVLFAAVIAGIFIACPFLIVYQLTQSLGWAGTAGGVGAAVLLTVIAGLGDNE